MRQDRASTYRHRLRRSLDSFEFSALIEGVSTLDQPVQKESDSSPTPTTALITPIVARPSEGRSALDELPIAAVTREHSGLEPVLPGLEPASAPPALHETHAERLAAALEALSTRLRREIGALSVALDLHDLPEAGLRLARVNQLLELIHSVDAAGDFARQLRITGAPPPGRHWPATAWSVVEFAASPLSGLLPPNADEAFVRKLIYEAWGMRFF